MNLPRWSTACPDWAERILSRRSLIPFEPLFPDEADAALAVFRDMRIVDAAGRPTFGEAARPWVFDFVRAIFGAYDAETGRRLIQQFMLLISKKNGKSTLAAAIMVTALIRNWRESGEFYILAPTKEVADNSYIPARDMVMADPDLKTILKPAAGRTIEHRNTGAFLKVIAADNETVTGKKTIGLLVDELHVFGKRANAESMLLEATGGLASRPEGFVIYLSTQSDEKPVGVFAQKLREFRAIRDGEIIVPGSLPILHEFPQALIESQAFTKREFWYVTNPNLGSSVDERYLIEKHDEAERAGRAQLLNFYAKHLNIEIGDGISNDGWRGADYWDDCADRTLTLDELMARSEVATFGADGGGLDDLFGIAAIGREKGTRKWLLWNHAFAHPKVLQVRKGIATKLREFEREGSLTFCGVSEYVARIAAIVARLRDAGLLPEKDAVGFDPNNIAAFVDELAKHEITGAMLRRLLQGPALSPALWGLEHKLSDGTIAHAGSALMTWCVGNAKVEVRGNGNMVTKQAAGRAKIDPFIATLCAAILMSWNPKPHRRGNISEFLRDPIMVV